MIPNLNYHDAAIFGIELDRVFRRGWQFVALREELANNRDFIRIDYPDEAIVVQNFSGELRAFRNVCTHRLNLIQTAERGNRPLSCSYHGWTFGLDGMPLGMAKRSDFLELGEAPDRLCLTRFRLEACGRFLFVSRDPAAPSLDAFLGPFAAVLQSFGDHIGSEIHFGSMVHRANWKLLVENVLECYHCTTVHPETFIAGLGVGQRPMADLELGESPVGPIHSSSHLPRTPVKREALRRRLISHLEHRSLAHDSFFHIHIFPNLFLSSTEGTSFYIGHALPRAANNTLLRIRFFEPAVLLDEKGRKRQDAINSQSIPLGLQVIEEDRAILETVQSGVTVADKPALLGSDEIRINTFHRAYARSMGDAPPG